MRSEHFLYEELLFLDRGFVGYKHLEKVGLIPMNGTYY